MKLISFLALFLVVFASSANGQLYRLENNQKVGVNALIYNETPIIVTEISTQKEAIANERYNGGLFFMERIFRSQFGLSMGLGLIRRNVDARILSVDTSIEEQGSVIQISGRSYFDRHRKTGINWQIGMDYAYISLTSKFIIGTTKLDGETAKANMNTYGIYTGADWLFKNSGLRINIGYMFGEQADNESIDDIFVQYRFNTVYFQFGTFAFF